MLYQLSYTRIIKTYSDGGIRTRDAIEVSLYYGTCTMKYKLRSRATNEKGLLPCGQVPRPDHIRVPDPSDYIVWQLFNYGSGEPFVDRSGDLPARSNHNLLNSHQRVLAVFDGL